MSSHPLPLFAAIPLLPLLVLGQMRPSDATTFQATIGGAVTAQPRGSAVYGVLHEGPGRSRFTMTLGAESSEGAILFTQASPDTPAPGHYPLVDAAGDLAKDETRALIVLGSPTKPQGAFRATGGTLRITRSQDGRLAGTFDLQAVGYLADRPEDESVVIEVRGSFDAGVQPEADLARAQTDTTSGQAEGY